MSIRIGVFVLSEELKNSLAARQLTIPTRTARLESLVEPFGGLSFWQFSGKMCPLPNGRLVLSHALHSGSGCAHLQTQTLTNAPSYNRTSALGVSLPTWMSSPGPVLMRHPVESTKYDSLVDKMQLLECNPKHAHVRSHDGREDMVSTHHLAPSGLRATGGWLFRK